MTTAKQLVFDLEIYSNYFLAAFLNVETGNVRYFEKYDGHPLDIETIRRIVNSYELIGFNSSNFDLPILSLALAGASNEQLKKACDAVITNNIRYWQFEKKFGVQIVKANHIDLIEVAPGTASLKLYGGRMHCPTLQDLPIEPDASISVEDRANLRSYCANDLATTAELAKTLKQQIDLRRTMSGEYKQDLRSKSDAQIAEAVIRAQVSQIMGFDVEKPALDRNAVFRYQKPGFIVFDTEPLQNLLGQILQADFYLSDGGKVLEPDALRTEIKIGNSVYRLGIGGLHSSEKRAAHVSDDEFVLIDRDVASYYPAIILNCGLYPQQMGEAFLAVYRDIVAKRLAAKHNGNKVVADALKITINGSFGKFGSQYSRLFSPNLLIQTTVTGQLALLMLIESLELRGIPVVSANTDGVVIKCPRAKLDVLADLVFAWECVTGFETEETRYKALYSRDVNNYVAIKDGGYKAKGVYAPTGIHKNPDAQITVDAAIAYLIHGKPVADTIRACSDIRQFVKVRRVNGGGAVYGDQFLGRVVRCYYARGAEGAIHYKVNGYKVPDTDGARPLQVLPEQFPTDVDFDRYIADAESILTDIGAKQ